MCGASGGQWEAPRGAFVPEGGRAGQLGQGVQLSGTSFDSTPSVMSGLIGNAALAVRGSLVIQFSLQQ